jgi:hypothetical protein
MPRANKADESEGENSIQEKFSAKKQKNKSGRSSSSDEPKKITEEGCTFFPHLSSLILTFKIFPSQKVIDDFTMTSASGTRNSTCLWQI